MSETNAELRLPADSAYVAAVRLTTAALAARLGFTLEDLEDARIAVSEACNLLLDAGGSDGAESAGMIDIRFGLDDRSLSVDISAADRGELDLDSFSWQVLDAVSVDLCAEVRDGLRHISYISKSATWSD